jgi:hypothetical protein
MVEIEPAGSLQAIAPAIGYIGLSSRSVSQINPHPPIVQMAFT